MNSQLKILQFKNDMEKPLDCYFLIRAGKELYFSSTMKLTPGLVDFRDKFTMIASSIDIELWDYWNPVILGGARIDVMKMARERKDMHIISIRGEKQIGELMIQLLFDDEILSLQSSMKEKSSFGMQPSFLSQQGASFYDNYIPSNSYTASRNT